MPRPMSKKDAATLIVCALILILICFVVHSLHRTETEMSEQLHLDIPLDDGTGEETVIYDIDSEVE